MGTRSVIAFSEGDGWRGRYAHWDGYPTSMGVQLHRIVARDGLKTALQVLTADNYGWSTIDAGYPDLANVEPDPGADYGTPSYQAHMFSSMYADGRFRPMTGYGIAYTTESGGTGQPQSSADDWITHDGDDWGTEWAYVLSDRGVAVFERQYPELEDGTGSEHATGFFGANSTGAVWHLVGFVHWDDPEERFAPLEGALQA